MICAVPLTFLYSCEWHVQSGDPACRAVWNLLCDISRREFQRVYDALGVTLTEVGESFYNPMIAPTLDLLTEVSCNGKTLIDAL